MDQSYQQLPPLKSALFVDFDNIYIGLTKTDPQAAERFATDPARWLSWLEQGLPLRDGVPVEQARQRSILIRRCYPNPDAGFRRFRSFFTSAAFSVIDCPSQTRTGKNSADIYMVMDILDTLNHRTNFDEFIIFSGDSDFMPVMLRLRAYDRRTTTLAIDFMPPAYKASCDLVINEEEFIEEALGISSEGNCAGSGLGRARVSVGILKEMAMRVFDAARGDGQVAGADLPDILKDFREFRESNNWLGFGTSQRLAEALACSEPRLQLVRLNPMMYKIVLKPQPEHIETPMLDIPSRRAAEPLAAAAVLAHPAVEERSSRGREKSSKPDLALLRAQIIDIVKELSASSTSAILLARASQHVVSKLGPQVLETQWAGAGSFKRLLQGVDNLGLEITTQPEPGYLYDPARHRHPALSRAAADSLAPGAQPVSEETRFEAGKQPILAQSADDAFIQQEKDEDFEAEEFEEEETQEGEFEESLPSLEEFTRRVSQVTGAPDLTPEQYAVVFQGMVEELKQIAQGEKAYNTFQSSKTVSDWCAGQNETISRSDIVLIFKGIIFQDGVRFSKRPGSYTALDLAAVVLSNVKALCRRARMELSEYEEHLLEEWIMGELEATSEETYPAEVQATPEPQQEALQPGGLHPGEDLSPEI